MPTADRKGLTELTPGEALSTGWRSWVVAAVLAAGGLATVLATQPTSGGPAGDRGSLAGAVVVAVGLAWLVLMGGAVLILRSYCFRALWDGRPVEPGSYLKGMRQVWGVLVVAAVLAVLGAVLMNAVLPGGLVVLAAVLLLVFTRPSGRALGIGV